jgi:hypothetical protein
MLLPAYYGRNRTRCNQPQAGQTRHPQARYTPLT